MPLCCQQQQETACGGSVFSNLTWFTYVCNLRTLIETSMHRRVCVIAFECYFSSNECDLLSKVSLTLKHFDIQHINKNKSNDFNLK